MSYTFSKTNHPLIKSLYRKITWQEIEPDYLFKIINLAKSEDLDCTGLKAPSQFHGDITTQIISPTLTHRTGSANIIAKTPLHVCGIQLIQPLLETFGPDCKIQRFKKDGEFVQALEPIAEISGNIATILKAERTLLNFIQRLSGITSYTREFSSILENTHTALLDTRKTTPAHRVLEKYATACGGAYNHRIGLFDRILFKDNHFAVMKLIFSPPLKELIQLARSKYPNILVEIEIDTLDQLPQAIEAKPDIIMLDNFAIPEIKQALNAIGDQAFTEISGGVTLQTLPKLAALGADFISTGALTHQALWKDISLDWIML